MSAPAPPPNRRVKYAVRGVLAALAVAAVGGAVFVIATTPPTPDSFYPKCTMYQATGLHCPGCGTGRAAHALLTGRPAQALAFNPFAVVFLPLVTVVILVRVVRWSLGRTVGTDHWIDGRWIWLLAVALVIFTVLRNVPEYPFTLLAPHEL